MKANRRRIPVQDGQGSLVQCSQSRRLIGRTIGVLHRISVPILLAVLLAVAGCGSPQSSGPSVELRKLRSFLLEETDSLFLGHFRSTTVTASPFRVYVPDRLADQIGVYDGSGQIVRFFGSPGEAPGELDRPDKVVVHGNRVFVEEASRFSVFDTTGRFLRVMHFPEGIYRNDHYGLAYYNDWLVIPAVDVSQQRGSVLRKTPEQNSVAIMDTLLQEVTMMGRFPLFYQEGEYADLWMKLDISLAGLMVVGYSLLHEVDLYDLASAERPLVRTIRLEHPAWKPTTEEIPVSTPIPELMRLATETSTTRSVFIVRGERIVLYFANYGPDYYDRIGDDRASDHFATVASMEGEQLGTLSLPGPIMARDDAGLLYIRLSSVPDEREIGVYELVVTQ